MPINPFTETLRSFAAAARRLPLLRAGKEVSAATVWRWAAKGIQSQQGITIRLESIKVGGTTCTSDEALARFFHALSDHPAQDVSLPPRTESSG